MPQVNNTIELAVLLHSLFDRFYTALASAVVRQHTLAQQGHVLTNDKRLVYAEAAGRFKSVLYFDYYSACTGFAGWLTTIAPKEAIDYNIKQVAASTTAFCMHGSKLQPLIGSRLQPLSGSRLQPLIGSKLQPLIGSKLQPLIGSRLQPLIGSRLQPRR